MTTMVLGGLSLLGAVLCVMFEWQGRRALQAVSKLAASALFLALALHTGWPMSTAGVLIVGGLVLSAAGDAFLLSRARGPFLGGIASFLLAHVLYAVAFVQGPVDGRFAAFAGAALAVVAALILRWLWPHVERPMRGPVVAYVVAISAMVLLAVGAVAAGQAPMLLLAAVLFFVSDIAVARDRFVETGIVNRAWGLPAYYLAQVLFAAWVAGQV